jgi:hypothetical protein
MAFRELGLCPNSAAGKAVLAENHQQLDDDVDASTASEACLNAVRGSRFATAMDVHHGICGWKQREASVRDGVIPAGSPLSIRDAE